MKQPMKPMDEALKAHYVEKELSEDQLDHLMTLQGDVANEESSVEVETTSPLASIQNALKGVFPDFGSYRYAFYGAACLLLVGVVLSLSLLNQSSLSEQVMSEIAYNHKKEMPVEVASSSINAIGKYLNRLDFSLISSSALTGAGWELIGGRYCAINGKLAAQLKVKNVSDNKVYTLYQAASGDDLSEATKVSHTEMVDGVEVLIWKEKGLLLGLASSP